MYPDPTQNQKEQKYPYKIVEKSPEENEEIEVIIKVYIYLG